MARQEPASWKQRARQALITVRLVFTPLSLAVIALFVWESREAVGGLLRGGSWPLLLLAVLLWAATNLLSPLVTLWIFRVCAVSITYKDALRIHCRNLPAKYLPGGIWHSVGRGGAYLALGTAPRTLGLYFLIENLLLVFFTISLGAGLSQGLIAAEGVRAQVGGMALLAAAVLCVIPLGLWLKGMIGEWRAGLAYPAALLSLAAYWFLAGFTFACYVAAFPAFENVTSLTETAGAYVFSWSIGYLALFAPQGIGVSDVMTGYLLTGGNVEGQVLTLMLGFRLVVLVADLACWMATGLYERRARPVFG